MSTPDPTSATPTSAPRAMPAPVVAVPARARGSQTISNRTVWVTPHNAYYTVEADLQEIRGRIDTKEQLRRFGLPLPVSVVYDEYGMDVIENQLLAGAALRLQRLP